VGKPSSVSVWHGTSPIHATVPPPGPSRPQPMEVNAQRPVPDIEGDGTLAKPFTRPLMLGSKYFLLGDLDGGPCGPFIFSDLDEKQDSDHALRKRTLLIFLAWVTHPGPGTLTKSMVDPIVDRENVQILV
jgi:hypothetical protein